MYGTAGQIILKAFFDAPANAISTDALRTECNKCNSDQRKNDHVSKTADKRNPCNQLLEPSPNIGMPLTADLYERNEYGDFDDSSTLLEGRELRGYQDQITAALVKNRMPEETERGIMHWYHKPDSVDRKVRSAVFAVEERDRQLWGVAECRVAGELSDTEMDTLKEFITGQASDGWCEGFEQREIAVDDCELHVHFWNSDEWSIQTEQERFEPRLSEGYTAEQRMGGL